MLKNSDLTESLIAVIKDKKMMRDVLLYRGDEELNLLLNILKKPTEKSDIPVVHEISINSLISACILCPDITERKSPFGSGSNRVMIILNAPRMANKIEISIHRAESVNLLKKMVSAIGLEMKECYVTNLIKCESGSAFLKPSDMMKNCVKVLRNEIEIIRPAIVIVMGDILPVQGIINSSRGITWFNTEHTISLIKNPELKRPAWETLKLVKKKFLELNDEP